MHLKYDKMFSHFCRIDWQ